MTFLLNESARMDPANARILTMLFPDHFDEHSFAATAVELAVEDLLPGAEVELAAGDRHHDLAAEELPLEVGVGVVLARVVVAPLRGRLVRRQLVQEPLE